MSTGWEARLDILKRDAEHDILGPLRTHGWQGSIDREVERGEYVLISAERAGHEHRVALMYSSATKNDVYKQLDELVEHIFVKGGLYKVESFAHGISTQVSPSASFHDVLLAWNENSADGRFAPSAADQGEIQGRPLKDRLLLAEQPIEAIWLRLRQLQSISLARKMIVERAREEQVELGLETLDSKAEGVAYALRNAADYYQVRAQSVSQRVLNLYYGTLAFAFAEMLASPVGPTTLGEIEDSTKQGHGLYTTDGVSDAIEDLVVGLLATGFFPSWMSFMGMPTDGIPHKKARKIRDFASLPSESWVTLERLFARIPEVADLYRDIFDGPPAWVTPMYDQEANRPISIHRNQDAPPKSYVRLVDDSARITKEAIAGLLGPISEIAEVPAEGPGRHFRVMVNHPGKATWWEALPLHHSPFERNALVLPLFGVVGEYRAICLVLLYALSIVVRYRPSLWRRVQEGDLDHMRALIEAFLAVVERVLPEQFLESVTGQRVFAKQPGSLF